MQIFKVSDFGIEPFVLISLGGFLIHIIFACIGFLLSVFITKTKAIISVSLGIVFITYFFSILASVENSMSFCKYLSPFSYYGAEDLVVNSTINGTYLVISMMLVSLSVVLTYVFYAQKDITA